MTYPGGKSGSGVYQQIINQIPPHRVYIEPFLGSGAVMRLKRPAIVNIGIESDAAVISLFWNENPMAINIINGDAISFLSTYNWQGDEFVYCDPPYLFETRSCKRPLYACEFGSVDQHRQLLKLLLSLPCRVAISGYCSPLYAAMLQAWRPITYQTRTRGGGVVTEWLWMNYEEPVELHDYRYLGNNFRQRERIKRIKTRWLARLQRMDALERYAILAIIDEYGEMIMRHPTPSDIAMLPATSQETAIRSAPGDTYILIVRIRILSNVATVATYPI
jgi:DNA adenine methylase